jgi:protein-disulfide isomerase
VKGSGKGRATPSAGSKVPVRPASRVPFYALLGGIAAVAALLIVWQANRPTSSGVITIDPNTPLPEAQGYLKGRADAPVQVLEFADFECPACGTFATLTEPDVRRRLVDAGVISFRFMDFPLAMHDNAWDAHLAGACANEQGRFWEMHDQIFATQDQWNTQATRRPRAVFTRLAQGIGLQMAQWDQCMDEQKYKLEIAASIREGERRFVGSTPTFVIGSRVIPGALGYDQFKAYVDSALAQQQAVPGGTPR